VAGRIAYMEQEPSIFAGTVRDNILFGRSFEMDLYSRVIRASCLERDFESFSRGDRTEIGEKGVMISGGQKARINLARALYSNADVYLLDDPLAAVDSKVAKQIFNIGIKRFLRNRTVIMVTHQLQFTKEADEIILMQEGTVRNKGTFDVFQKNLDEFLGSKKTKDVRKDSETSDIDDQDSNELSIFTNEKSSQLTEKIFYKANFKRLVKNEEDAENDQVKEKWNLFFKQ
jgi:ATP-binding cassette, subfamily C (CFTR/MRP), member 4